MRKVINDDSDAEIEEPVSENEDDQVDVVDTKAIIAVYLKECFESENEPTNVSAPIARLRILEGAQVSSEKTLPVYPGFSLIGRAAAASAPDLRHALSLGYAGVSSLHALLQVVALSDTTGGSDKGTDYMHFLEDLGSTNETSLGESGVFGLIPRKCYQISHGAVVTFGPVKCIYEYENEPSQKQQQSRQVLSDSVATSTTPVNIVDFIESRDVSVQTDLWFPKPSTDPQKSTATVLFQEVDQQLVPPVLSLSEASNNSQKALEPTQIVATPFIERTQMYDFDDPTSIEGSISSLNEVISTPPKEIGRPQGVQSDTIMQNRLISNNLLHPLSTPQSSFAPTQIVSTPILEQTQQIFTEDSIELISATETGEKSQRKQSLKFHFDINSDSDEIIAPNSVVDEIVTAAYVDEIQATVTLSKPAWGEADTQFIGDFDMEDVEGEGDGDEESQVDLLESTRKSGETAYDILKSVNEGSAINLIAECATNSAYSADNCFSNRQDLGGIVKSTEISKPKSMHSNEKDLSPIFHAHTAIAQPSEGSQDAAMSNVTMNSEYAPIKHTVSKAVIDGSMSECLREEIDHTTLKFSHSEAVRIPKDAVTKPNSSLPPNVSASDRSSKESDRTHATGIETPEVKVNSNGRKRKTKLDVSQTHDKSSLQAPANLYLGRRKAASTAESKIKSVRENEIVPLGQEIFTVGSTVSPKAMSSAKSSLGSESIHSNSMNLVEDTPETDKLVSRKLLGIPGSIVSLSTPATAALKAAGRHGSRLTKQSSTASVKVSVNTAESEEQVSKGLQGSDLQSSREQLGTIRKNIKEILHFDEDEIGFPGNSNHSANFNHNPEPVVPKAKRRKTKAEKESHTIYKFNGENEETALNPSLSVPATLPLKRGRKKPAAIPEEATVGILTSLKDIEPEMPACLKKSSSVQESEVISKRGRKKLVDDGPFSQKHGSDISSLTKATELKVMFTGLENSSAYDAIVLQLGGTVVDSVDASTHLVTDKVRRTVKFLAALSAGKNIVSLKWLDQCKKENRVIDASRYIIRDKAAEKQYSFSLEESLKQAQDTSKPPFLSGITIYTTPKVKPGRADMGEIIKAAGGVLVDSLAGPGSDERFVVIGNVDDAAECLALIERGITIHSAEFILTGCLKQTADFDAYHSDSNSEALKSQTEADNTKDEGFKKELETRKRKADVSRRVQTATKRLPDPILPPSTENKYKVKVEKRLSAKSGTKIEFLAGNWSTVVYISVAPSEALSNAIESALKTTKIAFPDLKLVERIDGGALHVSLSRTVFLKEFQIPRFVELMKQRLESKEIFKVSFGKWSAYLNDDGTKTFLSINVEAGFSEVQLKALANDVNHAVKTFSQPTFYKDPCFHASVGYVINTQETKEHSFRDMDALAVQLRPELNHTFSFSVFEVHCKTGNQVIKISLLGNQKKQ